MTTMQRQIIVIAHNIRSTHNVGSLLRTADGLGVEMVYLTGYTPYPTHPDDDRMPHISRKLTAQIHKTALGAETTQAWRYNPTITDVLEHLRNDGYTIAALEQTNDAQPLPDYQPPAKLAIILGQEVEGIEAAVLAQTDLQLVIPMFGYKESFNVSQAAAMALYHCTFARQ